MPSPSKKQVSGSANAAKRRCMGGGGHKGPFGGFSSRFVFGPLPSNTFATNSKPRMLIKQTMINKRRRAVAKVKQLLPLERRWYFALLLSKVRVMYGGKAPMKKVEEIARRAGVSVTTLNRWCKDANAGTSLMRQSGCDRPRAVTSIQESSDHFDVTGLDWIHCS